MDFNINVTDDEKIRKIKTGVDLLLRMVDTHMTQISDFVASVTQQLARIELAHDGAAADIQALIVEVNRLRDAAGAGSPQEQQALNDISSRITAVADRAENIDNMTPKAPPT